MTATWDVSVLPSSWLDTEQQVCTAFPVQSLSWPEIAEVYDYTTDGSQALNSFLRGATPVQGIPEKDNVLQQLCEKFPTPIPFTVFRGVKNTGYLPDDLTGKTVVNYGFTSTTFDVELAQQFAYKLGPVGIGADKAQFTVAPVIFEISVPVGVPCIPVNAIISPEDVSARAEFELILIDGVRLFCVSEEQKFVEEMGMLYRWIKCVAQPPAGDPFSPAPRAPALARKAADVENEARDADGKWVSESAGLDNDRAPKTNMAIEDRINSPKPSDLTDLENLAVEHFTTGDYHAMNCILWGEESRVKKDRIPQLKKHIRSLRRAINKYALPEPVEVMRGVDGSKIPKSDLTGKKIYLKGFSSCSFHAGTAGGFTHGSPTDTLLDIKLLKGQHCLPTANLANYDDEPHEHELILPSDTELDVKEESTKRIKGRKVRIIHCIVQNQKTATDTSSEARDAEGRWTREGFHELDEHERYELRTKRKLVIPPAWTKVQIADDENAALQALGRDSKGRAQYLYSAEHTANQAAAKFERIKQFHQKVKDLDDALSKDAKSDDAAATVMLMRRMGMRPGSDSDTGAEKQAHGATNLRVSDVVDNGEGAMSLDFTGKDGVHIKLPVKDKEVEDMIRQRLATKGPDERIFDATERDATQYFKKHMEKFKLKDMRTYFANDLASKFIDAMGKPSTKREYRQMRNEIGDKVSEQLGNTRTMALNSYINPTVFAPWSHIGGEAKK